MIGQFVTIKPIISSRYLLGTQGKIVGVYGNKTPFHYIIQTTGDKTVMVRGDELIFDS